MAGRGREMRASEQEGVTVVQFIGDLLRGQIEAGGQAGIIQLTLQEGATFPVPEGGNAIGGFEEVGIGGEDLADLGEIPGVEGALPGGGIGIQAGVKTALGRGEFA